MKILSYESEPAAERRKNVHDGVRATPSLAPLASPPHEGEINACNVRALFSPSVRGRAAEGGRGSLTHHLEHSLAAPRLPRLTP
jgi:hypothetical protein